MIGVQPAFLRRLTSKRSSDQPDGGQRRYSRADIASVEKVSAMAAEGLTLVDPPHPRARSGGRRPAPPVARAPLVGATEGTTTSSLGWCRRMAVRPQVRGRRPALGNNGGRYRSMSADQVTCVMIGACTPPVARRWRPNSVPMTAPAMVKAGLRAARSPRCRPGRPWRPDGGTDGGVQSAPKKSSSATPLAQVVSTTSGVEPGGRTA